MLYTRVAGLFVGPAHFSTENLPSVSFDGAAR
jgi:hypothetical protein